MTTTVLVTGATGSVGSRLVSLLAARGLDVRALTRRPDAPLLHHDRVSRVVGDFARPASLDTALAGVDAVFLACGNVPEQVAYESALIEAAARIGVPRVVKLSARGTAPDATVAYWRWHAEIEARLRASGLPSVVLRPSFSMANLFAAAEHVSAAGMLAAPAGTARIAMIDPLDVARVAAEALTGTGHLGRTYTLTGPEAIGYQQVAEDLGRVTRRPVRFVDVPPEGAVAAMTGAGLPAFVAEQIAAVFAALRAGGQATTTDDVAVLTGQAGRTFGEFAEDVAAAFVGADEPDAAVG
jgi:uncharacterized protein YbjT (DUF2867 family)